MLFWLTLVLAAQQLPTLPATPPADVIPLPVALPAGPPKLIYAGQPLSLPSQCGEEEIQALGLGCTRDEPCPLFLEFSGLEIAGNSIFVSGNLHTDLITLESVLLASEDSGKSWMEAHPRVRQGVLDQIQFIDFQNGWVAGQVMQTIARDPFILLTSDGGKTWRRRPMFDDSRVGSIEYFHFTSKTQGTLVLDRSKAGDPNGKYESFESSTGGSSWSIREVSRTFIKPKRPLPGNGDWRLRPDAASKAYRIERRTGATWQTVASFLIRLPGCMPPESKPLAEPPPEPAAPEPVVAPPPPAARKTTGRPSLRKK